MQPLRLTAAERRALAGILLIFIIGVIARYRHQRTASDAVPAAAHGVFHR